MTVGKALVRLRKGYDHLISNTELAVTFKNQIWKWLLFLGILLITGMEYDILFGQAEDKVLIREPGTRRYNPPVPASTTAIPSWEYAVLSGNSYLNYWTGFTDPAPWEVKKGKLPLMGWKPWDNFLSPALISDAIKAGLYLEVWEKEFSSPPVIAIIFRGTDASLMDWLTNLRWFWLIPFFRDQYTIVAQDFGQELIDHLAKKMRGTNSDNYTEVKIIAAGHSLGGGLAQHFAYALPGRILSDGSEVPRVSEVYAFDPSPVTGWFSVKDKHQRMVNVSSLKIDRIFEHGEFLAYIRLLLSFAIPPPEWVREVRYNFVKSANPFKSHSPRILARGLMKYGKQGQIQDNR